MADVATLADFTNGLNALVTLRRTLPDPIDPANNIALAVKALLLHIQDLAIASDAGAKTYLAAKRKFVINNDGVDRIITFNNTAFTFAHGVAYCMDSDEQFFFLAKALESQYGLVATDATTWVSSGVAKVFYW